MPESSALSAGSVSYTTTDVNAGLCITGVVKVGEKCGQQCGGSSPYLANLWAVFINRSTGYVDK